MIHTTEKLKKSHRSCAIIFIVLATIGLKNTACLANALLVTDISLPSGRGEGEGKGGGEGDRDGRERLSPTYSGRADIRFAR